MPAGSPPAANSQKGGISMKVTINARKVSVDQVLIDHIEKKLSKFDKYFPGEASATVKLSRIRENERVEVTIQQGSLLFRGEDENDTFMNALDCCMDAIERQIRKNKTRLTKRMRENIRIPEYTEEDIPLDEPEDIFQIRRKSFVFKPMTPEEAILQMNLLAHTFFVFNNMDTGDICVVYKRKDGNYGMIEPEK
jgi:putative sigma-54 modulation protein